MLFSRNFYSAETHMENIQYTNVLRIICTIDYNHQLIKTLIGITWSVICVVITLVLKSSAEGTRLQYKGDYVLIPPPFGTRNRATSKFLF